jgi:hypothetical protein
MSLYHSVGIAYGIEIPTTIGIDDIDDALQGQPNSPDNVGYIVVGDLDRLLLVTRHIPAEENTVTPLTPDIFTAPELTEWTVALRKAAVRVGCPNPPAPTWLVIHNYR